MIEHENLQRQKDIEKLKNQYELKLKEIMELNQQ